MQMVKFDAVRCFVCEKEISKAAAFYMYGRHWCLDCWYEFLRSGPAFLYETLQNYLNMINSKEIEKKWMGRRK